MAPSLDRWAPMSYCAPRGTRNKWLAPGARRGPGQVIEKWAQVHGPPTLPGPADEIRAKKPLVRRARSLSPIIISPPSSPPPPVQPFQASLSQSGGARSGWRARSGAERLSAIRLRRQGRQREAEEGREAQLICKSVARLPPSRGASRPPGRRRLAQEPIN